MEAGRMDLLNLDELTAVCLRLDVRDLARVAQSCKQFVHWDGGPETAELPTRSPVITALLQHAFPSGEMVPNTRPTGCSES
jgi:hypothetical protein